MIPSLILCFCFSVCFVFRRVAAEDEKSLLQEVMNAGLDEASLPELQQQLRDLLSGDSAAAGAITSDYGVRSGEGSSAGVDMSQLDALLREADDDDTDDFAVGIEGDDVISEEILVEDDSGMDNEIGSSDLQLGMQGDWDKIIKKYVHQSNTVLEKERDEYLSQMEHSSWKEATSETELYAFHRDRYVIFIYISYDR